MAKEKSGPENGRAPRLVGLGHTGVLCGYPGCEDRDASESVIRGRGDIDHDFGGTSMEPRCTKHRGMEAPRAPRPRTPLPVDSGWRANRPTRGPSNKARRKAQPSSDGSRSRTERFTPAPRAIDVPELNRMRTRAKALLPKEPERTLEICARALKEERRLLAQVGQRVRTTMDDFRQLRREAKARVEGRGQGARVPKPRRVPPPTERRTRGVPRPRGGETAGPVKAPGLTTQEHTRLVRMSHRAMAEVERHPELALDVCDEALALLKHRSGSATLRKKFRRVRVEALIQQRKRPRR